MSAKKAMKWRYIRVLYLWFKMDAYSSELRDIVERINKMIIGVDAERMGKHQTSHNPEWVYEQDFSDLTERLVMLIYTRVHTVETLISYFKFEFERYYTAALSDRVDLKTKYEKYVKLHGGEYIYKQFEKARMYERFVKYCKRNTHTDISVNNSLTRTATHSLGHTAALGRGSTLGLRRIAAEQVDIVS
jgi:hypothetical protein